MFTKPLTGDDIERIERTIKAGDPVKAAICAVELLAEIKRLRTEAK